MNSFIETQSGRLINRDHITECTPVIGEGRDAHRYCWLSGDSENKFVIPHCEFDSLQHPQNTITGDTSGRFEILIYVQSDGEYPDEVLRLPIIAWVHCEGFNSQPVAVGASPKALNQWNPILDGEQWLLDRERKLTYALPVDDDGLLNGTPFDTWLKSRRATCEKPQTGGKSNEG